MRTVHQSMAGYWNHNTAYHPWILRVAREGKRRDVLDVGCGDGLLLERLVPVADAVTGIEPDPQALQRARVRLGSVRGCTLMDTDFEDFQAEPGSYDLVTFVATLHHMPLRSSLMRAAELLRPGGDLIVVGLAANRTFADWVLSGLALPFVRLGSLLHRESRDLGLRVAVPHQSLSEIREVVRELLPGAQIRRGLYYRYLLRWTRPA